MKKKSVQLNRMLNYDGFITKKVVSIFAFTICHSNNKVIKIVIKILVIIIIMIINNNSIIELITVA